MRQMCEIMMKVVLLMGLFHMAWFDYKTKLIERKWLLVCGGFGILGTLLVGDKNLLQQALGGAIIGAGLLVLAWISKESIGYGDGWLFVVTGFFLGIWRNLVLLLGSLFLTGVFAIICLVLRKKGKNDRIALAPFVLTAYVIFVL